MYDENGNDWTLETVLLLLFMFTLLGGWDKIIGWCAKVYYITPPLIRNVAYAIFLITAFYFALKYV